MRFFTFLLFSLSCQIGFGQYFLPPEELPNFQHSKRNIQVFDADNDGDMDILSFSRANNQTLGVYINDGMGNFTAQPFADFGFDSNIFGAVGDVNGDGFSDIFIEVKSPSSPIYYNQLLFNDGQGNFIPQNVYVGELPVFHPMIEDLNNDDLGDLIFFGPRYGVLLQDGIGTFAPIDDHGLPNMNAGRAQTVDIDQDGDPDFLISGEEYRSGGVVIFYTDIYLNDGNAKFTKIDPSSGFGSFFRGTAKSLDVNGDGLMDVIVSGLPTLETTETSIYVNQSNGAFQKQITNIPAFTYGNFFSDDLDGDGDQDIMVVGGRTPDNVTTVIRIFMNEGNNIYSELMHTPSFVSVPLISTSFFEDLNGDGLKDIIFGPRSGGPSNPQIYFREETNAVFDENAITEISIFPNPAYEESLYIKFQSRNNTSPVTFEIFSSLGQQVGHKYSLPHNEQGVYQIPLQNLPSGTFFLKISDAAHTVVKTFTYVK